MPSPSSVRSEVCDVFDREYCTLVGRGTSALTIAFRALGVSRVIFPAYTCQSVLYAATYADVEPVFVDVRPDYTLDPDSLKSARGGVDAVVPIHLFGHPASVPEVRRQLGGDVTVIEDACQAVGSTYDSKIVGTFGDVSVVSFQHKKPIDAGGGGAVLTDDHDLAARLDRLAGDLPAVEPERIETLSDHYGSICRETTKLIDSCGVGKSLLSELPKVFEDLYLHQFDQNRLPALADALDGLEDAIRVRKTHADIYRTSINHPDVTHPDPAGETIYYRYSLRLPDRETRDFVVSYLRDRDFHVSTLYDPVSWHVDVTTETPTADRLSRHTLNLWVAPRVDKQYVSACAEAVETALSEFNRTDQYG